MKHIVALGLLLCLMPVWTDAQVLDTGAVVREVDSLIQVSRTLIRQNNFDKAMEVNAPAERLALEKLGRETRAYWSAYFNHGRILYFTGCLIEAEKCYLEARILGEKVFGKENADYASNLHNLAVLYDDLGDYEKAEQFYLEAKSIRGKVLGKEHPSYIWTLSSLAGMYWKLKIYDKSEALNLEAKSIREKVLGKEHPDYAASLHNLAILYFDKGDYAKAEKLHLEAIEIWAKIYGKENREYAWSVTGLANVYLEIGDYAKAEQLHLEAKAIWENMLGREHPDYATSLNNLARLYVEMGNYEKAEPLHLEARYIREKVLGKENPDYAAILSNLVNLYCKMGNYEKANSLFDQMASLNKSLIIRALHHLSERELNSYIGSFSADQNQILSFAKVFANKKNQISKVCYDNSLFYKGFLLNADGQIKRLAISDSAATKKFNLLKSYERRLAAEYSRTIADRDSVNIAALQEYANSLEKDLARTVAGYGEAMRQVKWQDVQAVLKPGETAVEFVHYRYYTPKSTDRIMYAALVLRADYTEPKFISLFEEKELAPLLRGATGGSNFLKINALYAQKNTGSKEKSLYELIWQPLESLLAGSKTIYCSPSGLLHRINLTAIPANDGKAFGDSRQLVLLGSTRQLVVPPVVIPSGSSAYLAGGIRYDTDSTAIAYANRSASGSRSIEQSSVLVFQPDSLSATRGGVLEYLPATAAEVREIGQTLAAEGFQAKVDTGFYATEEAFRQLGVGVSSPRIVHLATHGYFFPDPVSKAQKTPGNFEQEPVFKMSDHPMIRSGLILAGAKQAWLTGKHPQGQEDGILTAYEISQMNLSGTELVVLSACETGLGDILGNEGVYGLQRAFKIAGAKYLVMSLWKVDDRSTQAFMTAFYRHWLTDQQPVPQAFRIAQRELRAKRLGAYDWAGFVLIE